MIIVMKGSVEGKLGLLGFFIRNRICLGYFIGCYFGFFIVERFGNYW